MEKETNTYHEPWVYNTVEILQLEPLRVQKYHSIRQVPGLDETCIQDSGLGHLCTQYLDCLDPGKVLLLLAPS